MSEDGLGGGARGAGMGEGKAGHLPCLAAPLFISSNVGLCIPALAVFSGSSGVEIKSPKSPKSAEPLSLEADT